MKIYFLISTTIIFLLSGCSPTWKLIHTEKLKGGGVKLSFTDNGGRQRTIRKTHDGFIYQEAISKEGQVISDIGWYDNGFKSYEEIYDNGKQIVNITWYRNGQKKREWLHGENGICIKSFGWYSSGQLTEENVYDEQGKYISAKRWYEDGTNKYEASFEEGKIKRQLFYNPDGTIDRSRTKTEMLQAPD